MCRLLICRFLALALLLLNTIPAQSAGKRLSSGVSAPTYTGIVATRGTTGNIFFSVGTLTSYYAKTGHVFPYGARDFRIVYQGWIGNGSGDASFSGTTTINDVRFQDSSGTCNQVLFSGSATTTITPGGYAISDPISIYMPPMTTGSVFESRTNTTTLNYGGNDINTNMGDVMQTSASTITPGSPCATPTQNTAGAFVQSGPTAIIGTTGRPSVCPGGDSISAGRKDSTNASGNIGYIAKSLGPFFGYTNMGLSSTSTNDWIASAAPKRIAFAQLYCSHVIFHLGINNFLLLSQNSTQTISGLQTVANDWNNGILKLYQASLLDVTSSTSGDWTSAGDQTTTYSGVATVNAQLATVPSPLTGYVNSASYMQTGNKWNTTGAADYCSDDGIHPTPACTLLGVNGGVLSSSLFIYP